MKSADAYSMAIERTIDDMVRLYDICCVRQVMMHEDGHTTATDAKIWSSNAAKAAFDALTLRLKRLCEEQARLMAPGETPETTIDPTKFIRFNHSDSVDPIGKVSEIVALLKDGSTVSFNPDYVIPLGWIKSIIELRFEIKKENPNEPQP